MEIAIASQSTKIKLHNVEEISSLPEEIIIEEILSRLPVKSLLRFRCVAKSWRFLISSKKFMKAHLRNSISFSHHRILFNTIIGFRHCSLPSLYNAPFTNSIAYNIDFGIDIHSETIHLVGCVNGLVCILVDRIRFILWNPSTKKFNNLPDFGDETVKGIISRFGFGFDELNDDYKVSGLLSVCNGNGEYIPISKVYSLRSNSWEVVEGRHASPFGEEGTYLSGKLHWDTHKCGIASFDLNNKVCGVIEVPRFSKKRKIGVLKGCLSLFCYHRNNRVDIWVMKEYGVKESWYKVAIVPYYRIPLESSLPIPFAICPNGEILLHYGDILVIYNPKSRVFRLPRINHHDRFLDLGIYIESLASVVPDAKQEN